MGCQVAKPLCLVMPTAATRAYRIGGGNALGVVWIIVCPELTVKVAMTAAAGAGSAELLLRLEDDAPSLRHR